MIRGRWTYHGELPGHAGPAWQLDDSGWWLACRTGVIRVFHGCSYCWHRGDDRRWVLYTIPPGMWQEPPRYWTAWGKQYGYCTHRRTLSDAMVVAERAYSEHIMKTLASL